MSYDLYLLEPVPGQDPMETLEARAGDESPLTPAAAERNQRIADALTAANPAYHPMESTSDQYIAVTDQAGIEVTLFEDEVAITFPYWDSLDTDYLLREIERAAALVTAETGWKLYDPQLETFFDPSRDAEAFQEAFGAGASAVNRINEEQQVTEARPPWWKRLFGGG
jgi:hypothetical protein